MKVSLRAIGLKYHYYAEGMAFQLQSPLIGPNPAFQAQIVSDEQDQMINYFG